MAMLSTVCRLLLPPDELMPIRDLFKVAFTCRAGLSFLHRAAASKSPAMTLAGQALNRDNSRL
jgi:hypothetical protein